MSIAAEFEPPSPGAARLVPGLWRAIAVAMLLLPVLAGLFQSRFTLLRIDEAVRFPFQLDGEEGYLLGQALRLSAGQGLYGDIARAPHLVDNYPPLYPALWSLAVDPQAPSLAAGRLLAGAGALAALAALLALLIAPQGPLPSPRSGRLLRLFAAIACALLFFNSRECLRWAGYARVDLPGLAFTLWGLFLFERSRRSAHERRLSVLALVCFALGLLTKQTLVAAPAACLLTLVFARGRGAWRFAMALALAALLPVAGLCALTGGRYWMHTVVFNRNAMFWPSLWNDWLPYLWRLYFPLLAAAALVAAGCLAAAGAALGAPWRSGRPRRSPDTVSLYFLLNLLSIASLAKAGSAENYLLEPMAALALFLGRGIGAFLAGPADAPPPRLAQVRALLGLAVCGLLFWQAVRFQTILPSLFQTAPRPGAIALVKGQQVLRGIHAHPGPVLCEEPVFSLLAGRPVEFQHFIMTELTHEGRWDEAPFLRRVRAGEFSLVVTLSDIRNADGFFPRYSPGLRAALLARYRFLEVLPRPAPLQDIFLFEPAS